MDKPDAMAECRMVLLSAQGGIAAALAARMTAGPHADALPAKARVPKSVYSLVNQVAVIYGRERLDPLVVDLYRQATGIERDEDFSRRLLALLRVCKDFPVPADFAEHRHSAGPHE